MDQSITIKINNNDPKTEGVKTYTIATLQDIADCVTADNLDGFITDFGGLLSGYLLLKATLKAAEAEGEIPEGGKIIFPSFEWIDDWK